MKQPHSALPFLSMTSASSISRWTDKELLRVLQHCKGNFVIAIENVLRHEATGRPPNDLIRHLSEMGVGSYSGHAGTDESPVSLRANRMNILPSQCAHASELPSYHNLAASELDIGPNGMRQSSHDEHLLVKSALTRFAALDNGVKLSPGEKDEIVIQVLSRARARHHVAQPHTATTSHRHKPKKQGLSPQEINMLSVQVGIAASLKEAMSTSKSDPDAETISYAVKASKNTFNEEFRQNELRNALESGVTKMACLKSLTDINIMTEEELITKAMVESLSKPIIKSEEQLARKDPIMKSEEELIVAEAMRKVPRREVELVASAKRQSLNPLGGSAGEMPTWSEDASCCRRSSGDDVGVTLGSDCNVVDIESSPSIQESDLDRKMPTQIPQEIQFLANNVPKSSRIIDSTAIDKSFVLLENTEDGYLRSIIVEDAGFSLVNGVYKQTKSLRTNMLLTRHLDLNNGVVATASVYQTSTQDQWILSITSSDYSPGSGMDVILYSARVYCNEELPSSSTKWIGVSHIVRDGPPPKVTELR